MGDILLRDLLALSSPGEWGIINHTLIRTYLYESAGGGAPTLFPPLPLPLSRLPRPQLVEVGGLGSTDARASDIAPVSGACCDGRGGACLASRWRTVGADETPGCRGPPYVRVLSSSLRSPSSS